MKPGPVHPAEDTWRFERADAIVKWCADNKVAVHGHALVWHAQTNDWFFRGGDKEVVAGRMKDHITTLVGRYKGCALRSTRPQGAGPARARAGGTSGRVAVP